MKKQKLFLILLIISLLVPFTYAIDEKVIFMYRAETNTSGIGIDARGNRNLTLTNVTTRTGYIGNGFFFDGVTSFGNVSSSDTLPNSTYTKNFTINAWVNATDFSAVRSMYGRVINSNNNGVFFLLFDPDGKMAGLVDDGSGSSNTNGNGNETNTANAWHMLTMTYNGTITTYIDGQSTYNLYSGLTPDGLETFPTWGKKGTNWMKGTMDEFGVFLWMNSSEVLNLYNNYTSGRFYPFDNTTQSLGNFTLLSKNIFTNATINNYSLSINGTNYSTTNASIITNILNNQNLTLDFTVHSAVFDNGSLYANRSFTNIRINQTYTAYLYPFIPPSDDWNFFAVIEFEEPNITIYFVVLLLLYLGMVFFMFTEYHNIHIMFQYLILFYGFIMLISSWPFYIFMINTIVIAVFIFTNKR